MNAKQLFLKVRSRDKVLFEGEVKSVTSYNDRGKFDVLDRHAQFISLIKDRLIVVTPDGKSTEIPGIVDGLMRVVENNINVYLGVKEVLERKP